MKGEGEMAVQRKQEDFSVLHNLLIYIVKYQVGRAMGSPFGSTSHFKGTFNVVQLLHNLLH